MSSHQSPRLLAAFFLGSVALAGCNLADTQPAVQRPSVGVSAYNKKSWPTQAGSAQAANVSTTRPVVQVTHPTYAVAESNTLAPHPQQATEGVGEEQQLTVAKAPVAPEPEPEVKSDKPAFPRGAPTAPRKSYSDITAHSSFGKASDYSWISGEVQTWRKDVRLRYASLDENDPYGGSLTLVGDEVSKLKDGEHRKLTGRLVTNDSKTGGPVFVIESCEQMWP